MEQQKIDLETLTITELKALAFEQRELLDETQGRLNIIRQALSMKINEAEKIKDISGEKQEKPPIEENKNTEIVE